MYLLISTINKAATFRSEYNDISRAYIVDLGLIAYKSKNRWHIESSRHAGKSKTRCNSLCLAWFFQLVMCKSSGFAFLFAE